MSDWAANLSGAILIAALHTKHNIKAPTYYAHVDAYHAFRDREFQKQWAKRPRRQAGPFNKT